MSVTKHRFIQLPIIHDDELEIDELSQKALDDFLADSNVVYLGHSICITTKDEREYGSTIRRNTHLLISIVYKDLKGSAADIAKASPKVKETVRREVAMGEQLTEPEILTEFDKKTKMIETQTSNEDLQQKLKKIRAKMKPE